MRRRTAVPLAAAGALVASLVVAVPAQAHGYLSGPPSRQALCAQGRVADCGQIGYEPQSVEGPQGQRNCSAGDSRWAVLDDDARGWPVTGIGSSVTLTWTNTAQHATRNWEYYIGDILVGSAAGGGQQPGVTVAHTVDLGGFPGRQKLLAIWNIADTPNAFYSCLDLNIGGGGDEPVPYRAPVDPIPPDVIPHRENAVVPPSGTWIAWQPYRVNERVTYEGVTYWCVQAHTTLPGWEPPIVPALWAPV